MSSSRSMESRPASTKQRYNESGDKLVAGVVPLNAAKTHVLLIQSTRRSGWVLPRGGWESDESCTEAVQREAWEEAGIVCNVDYDLGAIRDTRAPKHMSKDAPKSLYQFYEVTVTREEADWPEKHKRTRQWANFAEASEALKHRPELLEALKRSTIERGVVRVNNHDSPTSKANLASMYQDQGRRKEAEELLVPNIPEGKQQEFVSSSVSPQTLQSTLVGGRIEDVKRLLYEHFSSVAKGDFIWLQELREHGYETEAIAELLATEQNDSPWIYFVPRKLSREAIIPDHHEDYCVHMGGQEVRRSTGSISSITSMNMEDHQLSWTSDNESLTYIEELCGIAGVIPNTRDLGKRVGSVKFVEGDGILTASISFRLGHYSDSKLEEKFEPSGHVDRVLPEVEVEYSNNILQALGNLRSAIGYAQRRGICCDSFTVLKLNSIISAQEVIELCQIRVTAVLDLYSKFSSFLANLRAGDGSIQKLMLDILDCGRSIFQGVTLSSFTAATFEGILDYYSLAVQLLSLGFSSYVKAHIGAVQPFFLDTSLHVIKLFGLQDWKTQSPQITASLYRLTCLDDMIRNPVLVFREGRARKQDSQGSYDLLASPEDLVDTWGPGQFVTRSTTAGTQSLTSIMIGGGVIKPTAENNKVLHWSNDVEPRHRFSVHFSSTEKALIAGGVKVNGACQTNKTERWSSFMGSLKNLGTTADYWQFTEFQAGVAVMGQQFAGGQLQFNKTWTWHPGNSWKRQHLSLIAEELPFSELDRPWGLQVSACTGIARRVPLRLLLADTMQTFAENLALPPGWTILQQRGIIRALEQGGQNLKQWYDELCNVPNFQDLQILTKRLIRHILLVLRDTGIARDHRTFLIACPQDYATGDPISMSLSVPCENASLWARILQDSEDCATFACMTNLCFESEEHKCQQTYPWHCPSLDTAVQQSRSRKEPIIIPPQAWDLEVNSLYWIGMPEAGLQARVVKPTSSSFPRLYVSKSLVPEKTRARLGTMSRIFGPKMYRLREKQIETWPAQDVLVLSQSN